MNTIGKILVILNFVFAIVVGAFLVFDFATRTQWKRAYEELKREADVLRARTEAYGPLTASVASEVAKHKLEAEKVKTELAETQEAAKATEATLNLQIEEYKNKLKDADTSLQVVLGEKKRMTTEIALLNKTVADREKAAVVLEGEVKKYRQEALSQENLARTLQVRLDQLETLLRERNEKIAEMETRGAPGQAAAGGALMANAPNPPTAQVHGKVEKVDGRLVELSVGSDHGLVKNNTLEVYRTSPEPKYLGMVRIVDAFPHRSVGQLVPGTGRTPLREGDRVISRITP